MWLLKLTWEAWVLWVFTVVAQFGLELLLWISVQGGYFCIESQILENFSFFLGTFTNYYLSQNQKITQGQTSWLWFMENSGQDSALITDGKLKSTF